MKKKRKSSIVIIINQKKKKEIITRLIRQKKRQYLIRGQIIIYYERINITQRLAEVLECACFHRNVDSKEQKSRILQQFRSMTQPVLTLINALELGLDILTIRVVIHVGKIRNLREYA